VSSGECTTSFDQQFIENFGGFEPAECLAGAVVQFVSDRGGRGAGSDAPARSARSAAAGRWGCSSDGVDTRTGSPVLPSRSGTPHSHGVSHISLSERVLGTDKNEQDWLSLTRAHRVNEAGPSSITRISTGHRNAGLAFSVASQVVRRGGTHISRPFLSCEAPARCAARYCHKILVRQISRSEP